MEAFMKKLREHNPPRAYELNDPAELARLYRETIGYLRTCELMGHGTDLEGRRFAQQAFKELLNDPSTLISEPPHE